MWHYLMAHISEISFKNRKNCTYLYDLDNEKKTTITTGYLKKTQDGLQILAVQGLRNRSGRNFSRRAFKMPAVLFLRICKDFSCKSSSIKSVRAAMFVSFPWHPAGTKDRSEITGLRSQKIQKTIHSLRNTGANFWYLTFVFICSISG